MSVEKEYPQPLTSQFLTNFLKSRRKASRFNTFNLEVWLIQEYVASQKRKKNYVDDKNPPFHSLYPTSYFHNAS